MSMTTTQTVYTLLAAGLMLCWLGLIVRGPRKVDSPGVLGILCYGALVRTVALILALAPAMIMVYMVWAILWKSPATLNIAGLSFLASSVVGGLLLIEVARVQVVVSEEGLTRYSPWSALAELKWLEVERVRYSSVNRWFVVHGARGTMRVSRHLAGIGVFVATVRRKVAAERWASAAAVLDEIR